MIADTRPGAGDAIAANLVAKAEPDGHTCLMSSSSFAINHAVCFQPPYDLNRDVAPVGQISE